VIVTAVPKSSIRSIQTKQALKATESSVKFPYLENCGSSLTTCRFVGISDLGLYCGCTYDSSVDMERNCPGITEEEHDEAKSMGLRCDWPMGSNWIWVFIHDMTEWVDSEM